ncbi:MAG TPA: hypothetical protein VGQ36_01285 [Thermoanaerobaculia bacterium]|nr:hypothetical protein [Thermoanaerobaculia bacterium]
MTSWKNGPKVCKSISRLFSNGKGGEAMTVRFFPGTQRHKTSLIQGFLRQFRVEHELVRVDESRKSYTHHAGSDPALEVDGKLFVDPNVDALKKIFSVDEATQS